VNQLSGGERNRVHLARILKEGANVLLLDEPTNDLDVNTLRALEEALENFAGCAVVISHDRWFLDRIATHMLAFEATARRSSSTQLLEYEADRKKRCGAAATRPHRIKYRNSPGREGRFSARASGDHLYSTVRWRGPSNSQKKIPARSRAGGRRRARRRCARSRRGST